MGVDLSQVVVFTKYVMVVLREMMFTPINISVFAKVLIFDIY